MVEIQELLNSLKFLLGLSHRGTEDYTHVFLDGVNTSNIGTLERDIKICEFTFLIFPHSCN